MVSSNCEVCGSKKLRFIKELETSGLLGSIGIKTGLENIHIIKFILNERNNRQIFISRR